MFHIWKKDLEPKTVSPVLLYSDKNMNILNTILTIDYAVPRQYRSENATDTVSANVKVETVSLLR